MSTINYNLELQKAVEHFKEDCKRFGQDMMKDMKSLPITLAALIQMPDNKFALAIIPDAHTYYDKEDKQKFVVFAQLMVKSLKPVAIAVLSEAWMVKRDKDELKSNLRASQEPDRKEVVIIQIETFESASIFMYDIVRNNDDIELKLDISENNLDKKNTDGIFSNMLRQNYDKLRDEFINNVNKNQN